eukprot:scaffold8156_cov92-Isochrysis_galbana.AAC.2
MLAMSSVFLLPQRASGMNEPDEPSSPPTEKDELISAHCAMSIGLPYVASASGMICSRLLSEPVAKPNWSDEPSDTARTVATSRRFRRKSVCGGSESRASLATSKASEESPERDGPHPMARAPGGRGGSDGRFARPQPRPRGGRSGRWLMATTERTSDRIKPMDFAAADTRRGAPNIDVLMMSRSWMCN